MGFSKKIAVRLLLIFGFMLIGFGASMVLSEFIKKPTPPQLVQSIGTSATVLSEPLNLPEFTLKDQASNVFTRDNFKNNWSLLFFGYTHCPDICPMTLSLLDNTYKILQQSGAETLPQVIFVSVDPDRDNNESLADYVTYFNSEFLGVSGEKEQLQALAKPLGIFFGAEEADETDNYQVNHSVSILLIDPKARLRAIISPPHNAKDLAASYTKISSVFAE